MFPIWHSIGLWSSSASRYPTDLCCRNGLIIDIFYRFTDCWLVLCLSEVLPCFSSWISWFCIFYVRICYRFLSSLQYMSALEKDPLPCTKGLFMLWPSLLTVVGSAGDKADFVYCLIWGWALSIVWFLLSSVNRCSLRQWSWSDPSLPPISCTTSSTCGARSSLMFRFLTLVWFIPSSDAVGVPVTGFYVPFVMIVVNMLMGQNFISVLIGIIIGHIFYFFTQVYPPSLSSWIGFQQNCWYSLFLYSRLVVFDLSLPLRPLDERLWWWSPWLPPDLRNIPIISEAQATFWDPSLNKLLPSSSLCEFHF